MSVARRASDELTLRLLDTLLREDVAGLRSRGRRTAGGLVVSGTVRIPVRPARPEDLLCDLAAAAPWVEVARGVRVRRHRGLVGVVSALRRALAGRLPDDGLRALQVEAAAALVGTLHRTRSRPAVRGALRRDPGGTGFETLAAFADHPLHPFSLARVAGDGRGVPAPVLRRFAPEHRPVVEPRWLVVPAERVEQHGKLPDWWPERPGGVAVPVHPSTSRALLERACAEAGFRLREIEPELRLRGVPMLSARTLALPEHPGTQLKLPLPVSTLGRLNLRRLGRAGLADGALVQRLLESLTGPGDGLSVADESTWVWAGHPMLAALVRRHPAGPRTVPVAALTARGLTGRSVAAELAAADGWPGPAGLRSWLPVYLDALLLPQLRLWLRDGVVLESHGQNVALTGGADTGFGLLVRDLDSGRLDLDVLADRLGPLAPDRDDVADRRLAAADPGELRDLFVTTTLHQSAAAVLAGVAADAGLSPRAALGLLRPALERARDRLAAEGVPAARLGELGHLLDAPRLPVKCGLSAATLLPKSMTGPGDVNKYYAADGPTYLVPGSDVARSPGRFDPDTATSSALLACLTRELAVPSGRAALRAGTLSVVTAAGTVRVAANGLDLATARPHGPVTLDSGAGPAPVGWSQLAALVDTELAAQQPGASSGLAEQVRASHALMTELAENPPAREALDVYLAGEQSLRAGHRHHPAPKARTAAIAEALEFAPEAAARFPLHHLAVRADAAWSRTTGGGLLADLVGDDVRVPAGYLALPAHPWQVRLLRRRPGTGAAFERALADGVLLDLGPGRASWTPTASVRTLVRADRGAAGGFLKVGLSVRITNCIRVNPRPEIDAAVALTGRLTPLEADLAATCPGVRLLREPEGRTLLPRTAAPGLDDALGVLVREPLQPDPGVRPVPAAALVEAEPFGRLGATLDRVTASPARLQDWWRRYLRLLLPPVWRAVARHGVVLEAHLQNVVVGLDLADRPVQLWLRDLEGAKLCGPQHDSFLAALDSATAAHLRYTPRQAWHRAAYCLLVNHVATVLGALSDRAGARPGAERALWAAVREEMTRCRETAGDLPGDPLAAVLAGAPVPAKTNLLTRWHDLPDRESGYVPVQLPLRRTTGRLP